MPFDGVVTKAVTEELQNEVIPGKINKIYQPTETELVFTIRSKGKNHTLLLSIHPRYARFHLTRDSYRNPDQPPMFCMLDRKSTRLNSSHVAISYAVFCLQNNIHSITFYVLHY